MVATLVCAEVNLRFRPSRYHSAVQNVSEQILEDHLPMSFLKELRSLYKRLPGSLDDDAEGAPV
jgi:hypothetical protein